MPGYTGEDNSAMSSSVTGNPTQDTVTSTDETVAVPKHIGPRSQSSKKFKIESVSVSDDPLYNPNASSPYLSRRRLSKDAVSKLSSNEGKTKGAPSQRAEPEGSGGEFQSVEDLISKPRSASEDQKYFSVEDVSKQAPTAAESNGVASNDITLTSASPQSNGQSNSDLTAVDDVVGFMPSQPGIAKPGAIHFSRRAGDRGLKFDDSFYKKATIEMKVDSDNKPDPAAVTDIFVPVPQSTGHDNSLMEAHENTIHETITSTYQTNLSINKLLRERHKGSLAVMGRMLGSKQRELEKQKSAAASLIVSSLVAVLPVSPSSVITPKKEKKPCGGIRPVHVCLSLTVLVIIISAALTLAMMQTAREHEQVLVGYHFDYKTRELMVYPWRDPSLIISSEVVDPIFKGHLGVNIAGGKPYNCTDITSECYKWHGRTNLNITTDLYGGGKDGLCLNVLWNTSQPLPVLEDCIDLGDRSDLKYGYWYGGFLNGDSSFPIGHKDVSSANYLPGEVFGNMPERLWLSTNGVAVVANQDIPLHVRIDTESRRLCLSAWYGHQDTPKNFYRTLEYTICRSQKYNETHELIMKQLFSSSSSPIKSVDNNLLTQPVFTTSDDPELLRTKLVEKNLNSTGYIIDKRENHLLAALAGNPLSNSTESGVQISPYIPILSAAENLTNDLWIQSTDMNVARLFNRDSEVYALLNSSAVSATELVAASLANVTKLVLITDLNIGDIPGQDFYPILEHNKTFQPFVRNFVRSVTNVTQGPVMTTMASGLQHDNIILQLQKSTTDTMSDLIRQILHASIMGYNMISTGEIAADHFTRDQFIRLLQLSVFLPVTQLSDTVLQYFDSPVVQQVWENCVETREYLNIVSIIQKHISQTPTKPLYTPMWWQDPESLLFHEYTQFMFNAQFLVAPVYNASLTNRTVSFPAGLWYRVEPDAPRSHSPKVYNGNKSEIFSVSLDEMLIFAKVQ